MYALIARTASGLSPGTTYYVCAIAQNAIGTSFGAVLSFTTLPSVPAVSTNSATLLTGATAQLNGTGRNSLWVAVQDPTGHGTQARGKQTLQPGGMFYPAQSGIWQTNSSVVSVGGAVLVIDPAYFPRELDAIAAAARAAGEVAAVVFTHGHWDHVMGHAALPAAPVWLSSVLDAAIGGFEASGMQLSALAARRLRARTPEARLRAETLMRMQNVTDPAAWSRVLAPGLAL